MSENTTPTPEPYSRVTIDLNDRQQLAAISEYYLSSRNDYVGQPLDPVIEALRSALSQFAATVIPEEAALRPVTINVRNPNPPDRLALFLALVGLLATLGAICYVTYLVFGG